MRWMAQTTTLYDLQAEAIEVMLSSRTLSGRSPRLVITDLGSEFENNKVASYCRERGIQLQPTPARAKELNGLAEKSVDTVKNHVRAMLLASKVPDQIGWARATAHHVFLWNRTHIGRNTGKTPREAMTGKEPSILNVGVFGCDAFVHQDRTQRDTTFSPKAEPGIYLGHDSRQNCPVVRMLRTGKTVRVKDVLFREGSFRHMRAELKGRSDQVESLHLSEMSESDAMTSEECDPRPLSSSAESESKEDIEARDSDDDLHPLDNEEKYSEPLHTADDHSKRQFKVRAITDRRHANGRTEYLVKWAGYPTETWEPADSINEDAPDAVRDYNAFLERRSEARVTRSRRATSAVPAPVITHDNAAASDDDDQDDRTLAIVAARFAAAKCL